MKKNALFGLALCAGLALVLSGGCKKRPDDNTREPEPWTDKPVENHHFDGGESDPYGGNKDKGSEGGGESGGSEGGSSEKSSSSSE